MADELEQTGEPVEWGRYLRLVQRRRWFLLGPFFAGWLLVWTVSWFMPSTYRSGTLILVEMPAVSKELVPTTTTADLQDQLDSITQQVLSRTRLVRIIENLNLYAKARKRLTPDDLVEKMRKNIEIDLVRSPENAQLTAFNIYFEAENPYVARQVTSELTNILITENLQVSQDNAKNTTKFLETQLEDARQNLATQEERVREFKDHHLGELPGQLQSNLQILSGLQTQLQGEQDGLGRAKQQNAYLQSLAEQYRTMTQVTRPGEPAVGLPALDQELDRLKAQLADLSSRYTDQHPDVKKLKEQIIKTEKMRQQLAADMKARAAKAQNDPSALGDDTTSTELQPLMEVQSQLKANQIEMANRQRSIADLQARIVDYQSRLNSAPVREQELADLTRDYDQSKANYDSLLQKKNQSELATNLAEQQQGEHFRVMDPPNLPTKPFSPNRFKLSLVGLGAGLAMGIAATVGAEFLDDRLYDENEIEKLVPVDVIAEIPMLTTPEEIEERRQRTWVELAAVAMMGLVTLAGVAFSFLHS